MRKFRRILAVGLWVIAAICVGTRAAQAGQKTGEPGAATRGSDWAAQVGENGTFIVSYKGVPIFQNTLTFWGARWAWAYSPVSIAPSQGGTMQVTGDVPDLHIKLLGQVASPSPNVLQIDLMFRTQRAIPQMIGGCWQWDFQPDAASLPKGLPAPELLPDDAGWSWDVGGGQAIRLRLEGASRVELNGGNKYAIRTWLVTDQMEAGSHRIRVTLQLPEGARRKPMPQERYDRPDLASWFPGALAPETAPVDLSFLNKDDRPAGRRGFVRAEGDRLVFADGTPARFWGANLAAYPLFTTPRQEVISQARRMARLGYNLIRIHHHDSDWVSPNVFGWNARTTRRLDPKSLDQLDWWIKCLEDEGIYVWLDMHVGRILKPGDGLTEGAEEVARQQGKFHGFSYYNSQLQGLMKEFQDAYLGHTNRYNNLRYADDPGVVAVLITNENDATHKGCFSILPDHKNTYHGGVWTEGYKAFAARYGLSEGRVFQTWMPGPSKLFLAQVEHDFNQKMIADLRRVGVKVPIVTTSSWGEAPVYALPTLADGDMIDVHSYGQSEALARNAHYQGNFLGWVALSQVYGKPLSISEWNVEYPNPDRFIGPLFIASIASLQGWDAPMIYNYSQMNFSPNPGPEKWSTFHDPALTAIMPAAALLFRQGHVSPARKSYCLLPDANTFFGRMLTPHTAATIRTLAEQSKLTIGFPEVRELPWLKPTKPSSDTIVITDPDHDYIPEGQSFVRSDTGEVTRDWELGIHTIDSPRTQAVGGWIGGRTLKTRDAAFETRTKKAVIALSSVDDRPLSESRFILVTAVARAVPTPGDRPPYLSEPVHCRITLQTRVKDLELMALGRDGRVAARPPVDRRDDSLSFQLPARGGTHWFVLKTPSKTDGGNPPAQAGDGPAAKGR